MLTFTDFGRIAASTALVLSAINADNQQITKFTHEITHDF